MGKLQWQKKNTKGSFKMLLLLTCFQGLKYNTNKSLRQLSKYQRIERKNQLNNEPTNEPTN